MQYNEGNTLAVAWQSWRNADRN